MQWFLVKKSQSAHIPSHRGFAAIVFLPNFVSLLILINYRKFFIKLNRSSLFFNITVAAPLRLLRIFLVAGCLLSLQSCFTGVEGTKKISLSRDDKKALEPSPEEVFFRPVEGVPLSDWQPGRLFVASDNKALLIFDQEGINRSPDDAAMGGHILKFVGMETRLAPDGSENTVLIFDDNGTLYRHNTGKNPQVALSQVTSDQVPMLIDLQMVESANRLLAGKRLWTRSALWYDDNGERVAGRKYVPVTVEEAQPGNLVFPVKLRIADDNGLKAWIYMNFGNSGIESRSFANLFSLSDIKSKYPAIDNDVWNLICRGKVREGMTKLECKLALGNPTEVSAGHDYSQTLDLWHYTDGAVLWFEDGLLTRFRQ